MHVNWDKFETLLVELATREIETFAKSHVDEAFYGFMFDCNSDYGEVLLCLNTEDGLQEQAEAAKKRNPDLYADNTLDELRASRRWNAGDWKYQGFQSARFETAWKRFKTLVSDICIDEEEDEKTFMTPTQDKFMKAVCRVLVRMENAGGFNSLPRTDDFKTYVADHDELDSESWDRLAMVRAEFNP